LRGGWRLLKRRLRLLRLRLLRWLLRLRLLRRLLRLLRLLLPRDLGWAGYSMNSWRELERLFWFG
jgi:hypothetical protein